MIEENKTSPIGAHNARGNRGREKHDFYPTPPDFTAALLAAESDALNDLGVQWIWEPACGEGHISDVLLDHGFSVYSSDIIDRGYPCLDQIVDFMAVTRDDFDLIPDDLTPCKAIITNPPFRLAGGFIRMALNVLEIEYLALFLKADYFSAESRRELFAQHPPTIIYPTTWRPDFTGQGGGPMNCAWYVWRTRHNTNTLFKPIGRPGADDAPYRCPDTPDMFANCDDGAVERREAWRHNIDINHDPDPIKDDET